VGLRARSPKKFAVRKMAHAFFPSIFGEVVLRDAREKFEVTKKVRSRIFF